MPIYVTCPNCLHSAAVPDALAGKAVRCPKCRVKFRVAAQAPDSILPPPIPMGVLPAIPLPHVPTVDVERVEVPPVPAVDVELYDPRARQLSSPTPPLEPQTWFQRHFVAILVTALGGAALMLCGFCLGVGLVVSAWRHERSDAVLIQRCIDGWLQDLKDGNRGDRYWVNREARSSLNAVRSWEILGLERLAARVSVSPPPSEIEVKVRVESSNKGGMPISNVWVVTLEREQQRWAIRSIRDDHKLRLD